MIRIAISVRAPVMLAVMPEDHWVSFDAGAREGSLLAGPWRHLPHQVFVNADGEGGSIEVELVDAYERPLPGFSRADCIAITSNGANQPVRWRVVSEYSGPSVMEGTRLLRPSSIWLRSTPSRNPSRSRTPRGRAKAHSASV